VTTLDDFNAMAPDEAAAVLRPCLDVTRWVDEVVAGRPYADTAALLEAARTAADPLRPDEVDAAMTHHPRIGESPSGSSAEEELSRGEQGGLDLGGGVEARLARGNREYEARFDRVFLVRAAGRTSEEILAQLDTRLANDDATEQRVVGEQLREIAVLRLEGAVTTAPVTTTRETR